MNVANHLPLEVLSLDKAYKAIEWLPVWHSIRQLGFDPARLSLRFHGMQRVLIDGACCLMTSRGLQCIVCPFGLRRVVAADGAGGALCRVSSRQASRRVQIERVWNDMYQSCADCMHVLCWVKKERLASRGR
jgi:hypothetical protein